METGRTAFARKGLAGTNLREDILEPAGVSVGSFYHQFQDKTELLLSILREDAARFRASIREVHLRTPEPRDAVEMARETYTLMFDMVAEHEDALRIQLKERDGNDPRVREFLRRERELWIGDLEQDYEQMARLRGRQIDGRVSAELISALSMGAIVRYLELPESERPAARTRLIDGLARFSAGGLFALSPAQDATPEAVPTNKE